MSSLGGISTSGLNFSGLATGIDTTKIVDGLTSVNTKRINQFQSQKNQILQQQSVFGGIEAKLLDLQGQIGMLSRSVAGSFDNRKVTSSDEAILTGVAASSAQNSSYNFTVNRLAQVEKVASGTFASSAETIKTGTVNLQVGSGEVTTITIDSTNNTIRGFVDAVNRTNGDLKASVINEAGNSRIMLSSSKSGAANVLNVTNNLTGGSGLALNLRDRVIQAAQDSEVILGQGTGAITIRNATNNLDNIIDGVSLNLVSADPTKNISLSVASDTSNAKTAIEGFVKSYNDIIDYIDTNDNYDSDSKAAGLLLGNRDVIELRNEMQSVLGSTIPGLNTNANRLSAVGLSFNEKGKIQIASSKLDQALSGQLEGVSGTDIKRLFALTGSSDNSGVSFLLGSNKTKPSPPAGYQVDVIRAARQASITGSLALVGSLNITAANNAFAVKVNSMTSTLLTVDPGTYTPITLSSAIQSLLNANFTGGNQVNVDLDSGALRMTSMMYGSTASVGFTEGSMLSTLGMTAGDTGAGSDVEGSYIVNGTVEAATGQGQILTGAAATGMTNGLQVKVGLTESQITSGVEANLTVTQGVASNLYQVLNRYLDPVDGKLTTANKRFTESSKTIDDTIKKQNEQLDERKNALILQFGQMEAAVSKIKNAGSALNSFTVLK
jgi:flagellar hook-associated protein 2